MNTLKVINDVLVAVLKAAVNIMRHIYGEVQLDLFLNEFQLPYL